MPSCGGHGRGSARGDWTGPVAVNMAVTTSSEEFANGRPSKLAVINNAYPLSPSPHHPLSYPHTHPVFTTLTRLELPSPTPSPLSFPLSPHHHPPSHRLHPPPSPESCYGKLLVLMPATACASCVTCACSGPSRICRCGPWPRHPGVTTPLKAVPKPSLAGYV